MALDCEGRAEEVKNSHVVELVVDGVFFFFQAEDGIRDVAVTGVQTCALPIFISSCSDDSGGVACRFISPCVRNTGGSPTRRWRSDDADCTSALSSSPRARSAPLYCGAAKSTVPAAPGAGASTIGAAAIAEGFGGRGGGAAGAVAPAPAGARWAAGAGPAAGLCVAAEFSTRATMAVNRPMSGTMRTRTMPRSAMYSNSVSVI